MVRKEDVAQPPSAACRPARPVRVNVREVPGGTGLRSRFLCMEVCSIAFTMNLSQMMQRDSVMNRKFCFALMVLAMFGVMASSALADLIVNMEFGPSNTLDPSYGGAGYHSVTTDVGTSLYIWVYAKVYDGPVTPVANVPLYNPPAVGGADDAILIGLQGQIAETSNGVHGDMTWGKFPINTTAQKQAYVYVAGKTAPQLHNFSSGSTPNPHTNIYGDVNMADPNFPFAPIDATMNCEVGDLSTWITMGHFAYTVSSGTGTSTITFIPQLNSTGATYQYLNAETGSESNPLGGLSGYTSSGPLTVIVGTPEPSTLILLGIGALGLLAYAWRRRK